MTSLLASASVDKTGISYTTLGENAHWYDAQCCASSPSLEHAMMIPHNELDVDGVSLRQVARAIHGLNSRLLSVTESFNNVALVLIYTFDVAGKRQSFRTTITGAMTETIADLFPEAADCEQAVYIRCGLIFTPRTDETIG